MPLLWPRCGPDGGGAGLVNEHVNGLMSRVLVGKLVGAKQ